jgi:transposase-like protein
MICPHCDNSRVARNGSNRPGRQRYKCLACGKTFNNRAYEVALDVIKYLNDAGALKLFDGQERIQELQNGLAAVIRGYTRSLEAIEMLVDTDQSDQLEDFEPEYVAEGRQEMITS